MVANKGKPVVQASIISVYSRDFLEYGQTILNRDSEEAIAAFEKSL